MLLGFLQFLQKPPKAATASKATIKQTKNFSILVNFIFIHPENKKCAAEATHEKYVALLSPNKNPHTHITACVETEHLYFYLKLDKNTHA